MRRPHVTINCAITADGKITSAAREYPRFTSARDRHLMDHLRAEADVVMMGAATLRHDDQPLQLRHPEAIARRAALGKPPGLGTVVVTGSGALPATARFFAVTEAPVPIVATVEGALTSALAALPRPPVIWRCGHSNVDIVQLMQRLAAAGAERVLCEGGGSLNWSLAAADCIDEIRLTIAPALLGGAAAPTFLDGAGFPMAAQKRLQLVSCEAIDNELFTHWRVRRDLEQGRFRPDS